VTGDNYDSVSNLNRPSVYRLNIGVSRETYRALFGQHPSKPGATGIIDTGHDFSVLDEILPHPVYAPQSWVCVLNPGAKTLSKVKELLAEAYAIAVETYTRTRPKDEKKARA
jgi:hypothetical protein